MYDMARLFSVVAVVVINAIASVCIVKCIKDTTNAVMRKCVNW